MTVRNNIASLLNFLSRQRRTGSTTALINAASLANGKVHLLVRDRQQANDIAHHLLPRHDEYQINMITNGDISNPGKLSGIDKAPVLLDIHAITQFLSEAVDEIDRLNNALAKVEAKLNKIKSIVS